MKKIIFGSEARQKLLQGAVIAYRAVCTTLSPKGRNVGITRQWGTPIAVHDGVTVMREVEDRDEFVNTGIQFIREAAQKTNEEAGDGTTTATLLAYHIIDKGMKLLEKGINPMILRKQMDDAVPALKEQLKKISKSIMGTEDIQRVAFISSADEEIGKVVAQAVEKVGEHGLITVEEGGVEMGIDYTEGMEFDKGYAAPHFVTSPQRMEAIIEEPLVAVLGKKVTLVKEIMPLLEVMAAIKKDILIVGEVEGDALKTVIVNKMKGNINILVVTPPSYGDRRTSSLEDIALITGATVVSEELGLDMVQFTNQFEKKWLGLAKTVVAGRNSTVIIKMEEKDTINEEWKKDILERNKKVAERIENLKANLETETSVYEKEKIQERLAKLTTGVAIIKVGAKTEASMRERLERTKDAVSAARAAAEEGIVPGGGVAFQQMASIFMGTPSKKMMLNDGEQLLYDVLHEPTLKLLDNAGEDEKQKALIVGKIKQAGGDFGYNVNTGKMEDLVKAGVIDPAKVIRLSVENAIAVAGTILSTDCLIVDEREQTQTQMQVV